MKAAEAFDPMAQIKGFGERLSVQKSKSDKWEAQIWSTSLS